MDDIIDLLKQLGVITIGSFSIVGLIGYLGKNLFEKYLESKINIHKSHLDKELERFKAELNKEAYKFQTKFSNLHIERAQITRELYKKLFKFYGNLKMVFLHGTMTPPHPNCIMKSKVNH